MKNSKISIGLINPKSPDNVHSVMRASGNYGVDSVFYTGDRYMRAMTLNPNAPDISRKVSDNIPLTEVDDLVEAAGELKIVCVELAENAMALPENEHPLNAFYVFGPEDSTIDQAIIDRADAVVYVPTIGCMNLAATVSVLLYDRMIKSYHSIDDNKLILARRDTNNTIKVRS